MPRRITLCPVYGLADDTDDQPFDRSVLPFQVVANVALEAVSPLFNDETWEWVRDRLGRRSRSMDDLRSVRYALVHRYEPGEAARGWNPEEESKQLAQNLAALLRLIRPMRQRALLMQGQLRDDETLDVQFLEHPIDLEVPVVQRLFHLRNQDAEALRHFAPDFLRAMSGEFWKFRMAVEFHEAGHFQGLYWKARYSLWCSALESIYTSQHPEHKGSNVARERIKWFVGANTRIYPPGDIPASWAQSNLTVNEVLGDIYDLRNFIAHGDKIPDDYFQRKPRGGPQGDLNVLDVCLEATSFILRKSLLRILRDGLLDQFANAMAAEQYFGNAGLTNTAIRQQRRQ